MTTGPSAVERLRALGFSLHDAAILADHFLEADRRGKPTHGVVRIDWLATLPDLDPRAQPERTVATDGFERWEGRGVFGYLTLAAVCDAQLAGPPEHARLVVAADAAPIGMLGYWTRKLAEGGLIALLTATSPARLGSPDGGPPLAGTNPLSIAVPSSDGRPLVADVSMAAVTHGHVLLGLAAPEEVAPFGGEHSHKAFALAVALQMLVDALVGLEGYGALLLVARPEGDPIPALRVRAEGIRLPGDS
jgi:LDH2 family malate/lactate/ureidoglycolate dehydrogenase